MEGYLHKRGRGRNFAFVKPWAERYFILDASAKEMSYYVIEKGGTKHKKGTININGCQVFETTIDKSGKPFSFEIRSEPNTNREEVIYLAAADDYTLIAWLNVLSLKGQNEVQWQPGRTPKTWVKEEATEIGPDTEGRSHSHSPIGCTEEKVLEGQLFRKSPVSTQMGGIVGGGLWVKRTFRLDLEVGELSLFNEVGSRQCLVESFRIVADSGSVQEGLEESTGHAHSFILKCKHLASIDDVVVFAAPDADTKTRLVSALCRALRCVVSPAASLASIATLSLVTGKTAAIVENKAPEVDEPVLEDKENETVLQTANSDSEHSAPPLTTVEVVARDRDARMKMQAENIAQLRERKRLQEANQSTLNDVMGKIQNRIKSSNSSPQHNENKVSDRRILGKKLLVEKGMCPQHHLLSPKHIGTTKAAGALADAMTEEDVSRKMSTDPAIDIRIEVIKILSPSKNMRKFLFIKELFSRSTACVDSDAVRKKIMEFEADYSPSDFGEAQLPDLPADGCTLDDVVRYIDNCEQQDAASGADEAVCVLIGISSKSLAYSRRIPCLLDNWAQDIQNELTSDPHWSVHSIDDSLLQSLMEQKGTDIVSRSVEMMSDDESEIQKCHILMRKPSKKSELIKQVVQNYEQRARRKASLSDVPVVPVSLPSHNPNPPLLRDGKRLPPPAPPPPNAPAAISSCNKPKERVWLEVPPPPRRTRHGNQQSPHSSYSRDLLQIPPPPSSEKNIATRERTDDVSLPQAHQSSPNYAPSAQQGLTLSTNCYLMQPDRGNDDKQLATPKNKDIGYLSFQRAVFKNKWCKSSIKKLTKMERMKKILDRGNGCAAFICKCCPSIFNDDSRSGSQKKERATERIGMSVLWLETIATKLGTFLPLSDREILVEVLYDNDPDGEKHVRWLSALLVSLWESPEVLRIKKVKDHEQEQSRDANKKVKTM